MNVYKIDLITSYSTIFIFVFLAEAAAQAVVLEPDLMVTETTPVTSW